MAVRQDLWDDHAMWKFIPDIDVFGDEDADFEAYFAEHDGELERVGIDDRDLTLEEARYIADQYSGGEFDDETACIVAAMCVLRDHIASVSYPKGSDG